MTTENFKKYLPIVTILLLFLLLMKSCQTNNQLDILDNEIKMQKEEIHKMQSNISDVATYIQELTKTLDYSTTIKDKNSSILIQKEIIKRLKNK